MWGSRLLAAREAFNKGMKELWSLITVHKPNTLRHALEECGTETIRMILLHGHANPADFPEVIQRISQPTSERKDAIAWLAWKDGRRNCWINVGIFAAVIAAVFSVLSFFALFK